MELKGKVMGTIVIEKKNEFGNDRYYPVNETAKLMTSIQGGKTLSSASLTRAVRLGFKIEFKTETWGE